MPRTVGRYEILRELGRGGMATVHLARQIDLDRLVALKELSLLPAGDAAAAARFLRESRVAGSLSHPNVVTVHDFFEHDGTPFIAMEFVPGGTLRRYAGVLDEPQLFGVLLDVLAGLQHAERFGVVHRDLKPENLLVTDEGRVKIADFGIAKAFDRARGATRLTATGTTIGTPDYIAPEQAMGEATGPWSDLYSLGCIAFELLAGDPPFADTESSMGVLLRHVNDEVPSVLTVDPGIDPRLARWVAGLVVKDPEERVRSAARAGGELEDIALDTLGPRWRSWAALVPEVADAAPTLPRTTAPVSVPPGARRLATTLPPTPLPQDQTEPTTPLPGRRGGTTGRGPRRAAAPVPPRRRGTTGRGPRRAARALLWGAALVIAAVVVFARAAGGGGAPPHAAPAATRSAPASAPARTRSTTARPSPSATPSPTRTPQATRTPSCAGDSSSDDPSDDACGAEP